MKHNYLIYSLTADDVVRFASSGDIVIYGTIEEAKEDAAGLGYGFFIHTVEDAMECHKNEIKVQLHGKALQRK